MARKMRCPQCGFRTGKYEDGEKVGKLEGGLLGSYVATSGLNSRERHKSYRAGSAHQKWQIKVLYQAGYMRPECSEHAQKYAALTAFPEAENVVAPYPCRSSSRLPYSSSDATTVPPLSLVQLLFPHHIPGPLHLSSSVIGPSLLH